MNRPQRERRDRLAEFGDRIRGLSGEASFAGPEQPEGVVRVVGERTRHRAEIEALLPARLACPNGQIVERQRCLDCERVERRCSATRPYLAGEIVIPRAVSGVLALAPSPWAPTAPQQGPIVLDAETLALLSTRMPHGARYASAEDRQAAKKRTASLGYLRSEVRRFAAGGDKERFDRAVAGLRQTLAGLDRSAAGLRQALAGEGTTEAAEPLTPAAEARAWEILYGLAPGEMGPRAKSPAPAPVGIALRLDNWPGDTLAVLLHALGETVHAAGHWRARIEITPEEESP